MNVRWITHYNSDQKILLVGEGDLSFSACLARAFGSGLNMVSTSLDSKELLKEKYWSSEANVDELERLGWLVLHEVDVKEMSNHPILKQMKFDDIVYNFPHAGHFYGYSETDAELIQMHKELLRAFFLSARGLLNQGGEVHVSHREHYPYSTWGLENLAAKSGFNLKEKVLFKKWDYPGYQNVRGGDINCHKPFPLNSHCFTYKFRLDENYNDQPRWNDHDGADPMAFRYLVMRKFAKKGTNKKRRAVKRYFDWSSEKIFQVAKYKQRDAEIFLSLQRDAEIGGTRVAREGSIQGWQRPDFGWYKVNFDGVLDAQRGCGGMGMVIRDWRGKFIAARSIGRGHVIDPLVVEAMAARDGLMLAKDLGLDRVHVEGDSQQLVQLLQRRNENHNVIGVIVSNMLRLLEGFAEVRISFVRRSGNGVAHCVAQQAVRGLGFSTWEFRPPMWLLSSLQEDRCPF